MELLVLLLISPLLVLFILLLSLPATFLKAWVIQHLWTWFLVPFGIVAAPSIWVIFGALCIYGLVSYRPVDTTKDDDKSTAAKLGLFFSHFYLVPLFSLFCGWLVQAVFL